MRNKADLQISLLIAATCLVYNLPCIVKQWQSTEVAFTLKIKKSADKCSHSRAILRGEGI